MRRSATVLAVALLTGHAVEALTTAAPHRPCRKAIRTPPPPTLQLDRKGIDFSQQQFDLLSLRSFRRDALLQYDATNQSEPLRIALTFLGVLFFLTLPSILSEAGTTVSSSTPYGMDPASMASRSGGGGAGQALLVNAAASLGALGSGALFLRNRAARTSRIAKIDQEYMLGDFRVSYRGVRTCPLRELRGKRRVIAVVGSSTDEIVKQAAIYRRRLEAAEVVLVPVYDASTAPNFVPEAAPSWLWQAAEPAEWREYFNGLLSSRGLGEGEDAWLGLTYRGRTFGSALGKPPACEQAEAASATGDEVSSSGGSVWADRRRWNANDDLAQV